MYLVINKCVTAVKVSNISGHYLRNRSTLDIGVLGYIGIYQKHPPEVWHIPPGTPCIYIYIYYAEHSFQSGPFFTPLISAAGPTVDKQAQTVLLTKRYSFVGFTRLLFPPPSIFYSLIAD